MNKLGVTLDLHEKSEVHKLRQLAVKSDVVIENLAPGYLDGLGPGYRSFKEENPGIVYTSITTFGSWGPYAEYKLTDPALFHMSGQAPGLLGPVEDTESDPPIRAGGHQAEFVAGMTAATATLPSLYRRRMTGLGAHVEVSAYEAMVTQLISGLANCAYDRPAPPRDVKQVKEATTGGIVTAVGGVLRCRDGYVAISPREDAQWERWVELMGGPDWAFEERFTTREGRGEANFPELWSLVEGWTRGHSKQDVARRGQERRIPCFPVNTVEDLFDDEHLRHRGFFIEQDHPVAGKLKYPGVPYRLSGTDLPLAARPAPIPGSTSPRSWKDCEANERPAAVRRGGDRPELGNSGPDRHAVSRHDGRGDDQGRKRAQVGPVDQGSALPGLQSIEAVLRAQRFGPRRPGGSRSS